MTNPYPNQNTVYLNLGNTSTSLPATGNTSPPTKGQNFTLNQRPVNEPVVQALTCHVDSSLQVNLRHLSRMVKTDRIQRRNYKYACTLLVDATKVNANLGQQNSGSVAGLATDSYPISTQPDLNVEQVPIPSVAHPLNYYQEQMLNPSTNYTPSFYPCQMNYPPNNHVLGSSPSYGPCAPITPTPSLVPIHYLYPQIIPTPTYFPNHGPCPPNNNMQIYNFNQGPHPPIIYVPVFNSNYGCYYSNNMQSFGPNNRPYLPVTPVPNSISHQETPPPNPPLNNHFSPPHPPNNSTPSGTYEKTILLVEKISENTPQEDHSMLHAIAADTKSENAATELFSKTYHSQLSTIKSTEYRCFPNGFREKFKAFLESAANPTIFLQDEYRFCKSILGQKADNYACGELESKKRRKLNDLRDWTRLKYHLHDDLIYFKESTTRMRLVATTENALDIIIFSHIYNQDGKFKHHGYHDTIDRVKKQSYGIRKEEINYVLSRCVECRQKPVILLRPQKYITTYAFERVQIDFVDIGHLLSQGFKYILLLRDHLSNFSLIFPLKVKNIFQIMNALSLWVTTFDAPKVFQYDNDAMIDMSIFELSSRIGIKSKIGRPRDPETKLCASRMKQAVRMKLEAWMRLNNRSCMTKAAPHIERSMNSAPNPVEPRLSAYDIAFGIMRAAHIKRVFSCMPKRDAFLDGTNFHDIPVGSTDKNLEIPRPAAGGSECIKPIFESFRKAGALVTKIAIQKLIDESKVANESVRAFQAAIRCKQLKT